MNVGKFKRLAQLLVTSILLILIISPIVLSPSSVSAISTEDNQLFMPLIFQNWPATPTTVTINPIDNSDQDNLFTVSWTPGESIDSYILEESANSDFSNSVQVYQGNSLSWLTPTGKFPGSFYYRAKGINQDRSSNWSISQFVTVFPLFVGLNIRMDAKGYIRGSEYYDIGYHATYQFNTLTDVDTIREDGHRWYDPNPLNFDPETWLSYFSPTTGQWKTSNIPPDPSWKWNGEYFMLAYGAQYTNGATVLFDGQKFTVSGPLDGYLTNGKPIKYWQFTNQEKFIYWDGGGDWKEYIHPGDIILRYDAGGSKLRLYSSVLRRDYNKNNLTSDTVQYIETLTSSTSIPGSPPFSPSAVNQAEFYRAQSKNRDGMQKH